MCFYSLSSVGQYSVIPLSFSIQILWVRANNNLISIHFCGLSPIGVIDPYPLFPFPLYAFQGHKSKDFQKNNCFKIMLAVISIWFIVLFPLCFKIPGQLQLHLNNSNKQPPWEDFPYLFKGRYKIKYKNSICGKQSFKNEFIALKTGNIDTWILTHIMINSYASILVDKDIFLN